VRLGVLAAVAVAAALSVAPAHADDTVVVRGTAFPNAEVQLSFLGCSSPYDRTVETLHPRIGHGPGIPPTGSRSLGYTLGGGNAVGSVINVPSLTGAGTASVAVHAVEGARGVAYAGFQEAADGGTSAVWFGRAELTAAPGAWHNVDATVLSYVWTQYDAGTGQVIAAGPARPTSVVEFVAAHGGDGPGLYSIGFGCDGMPFSMDAVRVGARGSQTTYDLEGLATATTMHGSKAVVRAGESVDLRGSLDVVAGGTRIPHATLVLEQRVDGSSRWVPVEVVDATDPVVTVTPGQRTVYRWRFVDRPLAEGSESQPFVVEVEPRDQPSDVPSDAPSDAPSDVPSDAPGDAPSGAPSGAPSDAASATTAP